MRAMSIAFGLVLAVGCGKRETPPPLPAAGAPPSSEVEEPVERPTRPTPAFVPAEQGRCPRAYKLTDGTCVHRLYETSDELALNHALSAYKRGAAPPMLGLSPGPAAKEPAQVSQRDPGSLMRRGRGLADAGSSKDQRLAELDAMLSLAREKLARKDEESRAKRVENAPRPKGAAAQGDAERGALDRFAQGMGGSAPSASDPTAARMSELSQIASQLSGEQLQALTAELGKTGFNAGALEAILAEARDEKPQ
jgi:hypothetical protein